MIFTVGMLLSKIFRFLVATKPNPSTTSSEENQETETIQSLQEKKKTLILAFMDVPPTTGTLNLNSEKIKKTDYHRQFRVLGRERSWDGVPFHH